MKNRTATQARGLGQAMPPFLCRVLRTDPNWAGHVIVDPLGGGQTLAGLRNPLPYNWMDGELRPLNLPATAFRQRPLRESVHTSTLHFQPRVLSYSRLPAQSRNETRPRRYS